MQQSTDPYYVEIANYPNQMHQQQADQIIYPVVPQDNYLINSDYNENNEVNSTRLKILFNYYIKQIFQIIGITLIFGINQIHGFSSIYLSEVDTEWWGSSFTYAKFRMFYDNKATIQEYYDWKEEKGENIQTINLIGFIILQWLLHYFSHYQQHLLEIQDPLLRINLYSSLYKQSYQELFKEELLVFSKIVDNIKVQYHIFSWHCKDQLLMLFSIQYQQKRVKLKFMEN